MPATNTAIKSIARNTNLGKQILTAPAKVYGFSLSNGFAAVEVDAARFSEIIVKDTACGLKMSIRSTGREGWYTVQFNSNRWYEVRLESKAA